MAKVNENRVRDLGFEGLATLEEFWTGPGDKPVPERKDIVAFAGTMRLTFAEVMTLTEGAQGRTRSLAVYKAAARGAEAIREFGKTFELPTDRNALVTFQGTMRSLLEYVSRAGGPIECEPECTDSVWSAQSPVLPENKYIDIWYCNHCMGNVTIYPEGEGACECEHVTCRVVEGTMTVLDPHGYASRIGVPDNIHRCVCGRPIPDVYTHDEESMKREY